MVQALNLVLLTGSQLGELRALLHAALRSSEAAAVFTHLFAAWSYSCAASLALALLAQVCVWWWWWGGGAGCGLFLLLGA
jgi:vacuole morphology and inheritance protein 14